METKEITNFENVIDSRDVIARIEELEEETEDIELVEELQHLKALAEEASDSKDWEYGETLIRDSYFEEYAQELAEDIGAIPQDLKWPFTCIDWEEAASELQIDYISVDFGGVTYWIC